MDLSLACQTLVKTVESVWKMMKIVNLKIDSRIAPIKMKARTHGDANVNLDSGERSVKSVYVKITHANMVRHVCCSLEVDIYVYALTESMDISANIVRMPNKFATSLG